MLRDWILDRLNGDSELLLPWSVAPGALEELPRLWSGATAAKTIAAALPSDFSADNSVVIGGVCSLFTAESEAIQSGRLNFEDATAFERWYRSWYPRFDQVHDCVGVPPRVTKRVVYVCEDSLFGKRIGEWAGLDSVEVAAVIRQVHQEQGHPVIKRWLQRIGYPGTVEVVYTSDLERELDTALAIWTRLVDGAGCLSAAIKNLRQHPDHAKVRLMYTGLWLDVLGVTDIAAVYEPAHHMQLDPVHQGLRFWFAANAYGANGINKRLGTVGFLPFWSTQGATRLLPLEQVPHRSNFLEFVIPEVEHDWYAVNMLFGQKRVKRDGPSALKQGQLVEYVHADLAWYYTGEED